jgi:hypothetical protein
MTPADLDSTAHVKAWLTRQPAQFQSQQASTNVAFVARSLFATGQPPPAGFTYSLLLPEERKDLLKLFGDSKADNSFTDLISDYMTASDAGNYVLLGVLRQIVEAKSADLKTIFKGFAVALPPSLSKTQAILANWQKVSPEVFAIPADPQNQTQAGVAGGKGNPITIVEISRSEEFTLKQLECGALGFNEKNQHLIGKGLGQRAITQYFNSMLNSTAALPCDEVEAAMATALTNFVYVYKHQPYEVYSDDSEAMSECQK